MTALLCLLAGWVVGSLAIGLWLGRLIKASDCCPHDV